MKILLRPICRIKEHDFDESKIHRGGFGCVVKPHIKCRRCGKKLPVQPEWMEETRKLDLEEIGL